jgi:hypothetical protein
MRKVKVGEDVASAASHFHNLLGKSCARSWPASRRGRLVGHRFRWRGGAICVKKAGGVVLVQNPVAALHDGVPGAAIGAKTLPVYGELVTTAMALREVAAP